MTFPGLATLRSWASYPLLVGALPLVTIGLAAFGKKGIVILLVLGAVGAVLRSGQASFALPRPLKPAAAAFGLIVTWALVSGLWSDDVAASVFRAIKVLAVGVCGFLLLRAALALTARERRFCALGLLAGVLLLLAQLAADVLSGGAVTGFLRPSLPAVWDLRAIHLQTGASVLAIFMWPAVVVAWRRFSRLAAIALPFAALAIAIELKGWAAVLALCAGALTFAAARLSARTTALAVVALVVGSFALAPVLPRVLTAGPWMKKLPQSVEFSIYHRAKIWTFTAERISERLVLGWGMDASRHVPGGERLVDINADLNYTPPRYFTQAESLPLHPHNGVLQLWLELGAVGAVLGLLLLIQAPMAALRFNVDRSGLGASVASFVAAFTVICLSYGIWSSWWQSTLWLTAVIVIAASGKREPPKGGRAGKSDTARRKTRSWR